MNKSIKVFVKIKDKIYKSSQIILSDNHYNKGFIERIIDGINCDEHPEYTE